MHRAPLGQLAMDGGNNMDQSMTQLLQSCTALHAVAHNNNNNQNSENMAMQMRKLTASSNNGINDENRGPLNGGPHGGNGLQGNAKADLVDLSQLASLRKNRAPTMSRRNERERNRVRYLNFTFDILRQHLPGKGSKGKAKKMSKVDTLRGAIDYIHDLQLLLGGEPIDDMSSTGGKNSSSSLGSGGDTGGGQNAGSQMGTESEGDSLSPSGSPHYSGGSSGVGNEHLSDHEEDIDSLTGWFC